MDRHDKSKHSLNIKNTKGNVYGYIGRRLFHVSMAVIPFIYYPFGNQIGAFFHMSPYLFLLILLVLVVILETLRLSFRITIFGQRNYEARQISALAWGTASIILVLLFSPGPQYSIPLIWSFAFGDPLLGELRRTKIPTIWVELIVVIFILAIWWIAAYWFGISWWWGIFLAPITVAVEWLDLKWIDDNALILLVPLIIILIVKAW